MKPVYTGDALRLTVEKPISNGAVLSIGGVAIPFKSADIQLREGEFTTITLTAVLDEIDITALQEHTRVQIVKE